MEEQEIDLRDYFKVIYKRKWLIVTVFLFTAIASSIYSLSLPKTYQAEAVIQNGNIENISIGENEVKYLFGSSSVLMPVLEQYNKNYNDDMKLMDFRKSIEVKDFSDNRFNLVVQAKSLELAKEISEHLINGYFSLMYNWYESKMEILKKKIEVNDNSLKELENSGKELKNEINNFVKEKKMQPEPAFKSILLRSLYSQYVNELSQYQEKRISLLTNMLNVKEFGILEMPDGPERPIAPKKKKIVIIACLVSLFVVILLAFIIEFFQKNRVGLLSNIH